MRWSDDEEGGNGDGIEMRESGVSEALRETLMASVREKAMQRNEEVKRLFETCE